MKKYISILISLFVAMSLYLGIFQLTYAANQSANPINRVVTDMSGRKVTIPTSIKRVISLSNNSTVYVYTIAPEKLLGWSFSPKPEAKKFIGDSYFNLPNIGSSTQKTGNYENILKLNPDVIICSEEDMAYDPDAIQKQLNIPVLMVDVSLKATDKVYKFLGDALGVKARGNLLASYSKKSLDKLSNMLKKIPEGKKQKVYYAEGNSWLQTDVSGNVHTEVLDFVNANNVANIKEEKLGSQVEVSMEQVLAWNPDIILVGATATKGDFYSKVYNDSNWANIKAVKEKKIYKIPALPFNWFDRPPCSARILGVEWLANLLYPEYVKIDLNKEIKYFYKVFYHYKISDSEIKELMTNAK